ncbi:ATP-binding cassette domain-containing protein [Nocardiopsis mangrovi]|uniref:ATP-binding cassette domain-containing protein n=1 Tax=Nocardiopsis mangrovi TaxID=1179818 RepID=A0ABV9DXP7_9ACTN
MLLESVGKRYDRHGPWIIRDVHLAVPESAVIRIEGANGRGKSTLLRVLAGISRPTAGRVTGRPPTAYVPERFPPDLPFHAAGYLRHVGRIHGLTRAESARRAALWIDRLGLSGHARVPLKRLSKGTSQKVAVAQALMARPGLLVLDEAWTGLDADTRSRLDDAVLDLARDGGRVVFVDHDPTRMAGRVTAVHRLTDGHLMPAEDTMADRATAAHQLTDEHPIPAEDTEADRATAAHQLTDEHPIPAEDTEADRATAAHRLTDERLIPAEGTAPDAGNTGPHGRIEADPANGTHPPSGRPGIPATARAGDVVRAAGNTGPHVHIEVDTVPDTPLPSGLPGTPSVATTAPGRARLTVAARHSDALLRHLLDLRPPVHIHSLSEPVPAQGTGGEGDPA